MNRIYICIDLKSFYASVECRERGLEPLNTNLVVADNSRTEKTICLAVSPSLKSYGVSGRPRLFEVVQKVKEVNLERKKKIKNSKFVGKSYLDDELKSNPKLELDYIVAPPRMAHYIEYSQNIYNVYLKYLAPEDIYVYSIDEVFCDVTNYLKYNKMSARELATKMIKDVYETTGITATCGIGTNMFLCKIAMDIVAKKTEPNEFGVRIAGLDEMTYRKKLWDHKPLTDFWRVGHGYAKKLEEHGMFTMGDIARCSIDNENLLYKLFGINAEVLIDHAWGFEPTTIEDIKSFKPSSNSLSSGQVLHCPYKFNEAKLVAKEMADLLALDLVEKNLVTKQLTLTIGYDIDNLTNSKIRELYDGPVIKDHYGRDIPKHSHGTINLDYQTSSSKVLVEAIDKLFNKIANKNLLVRRINISVNNVIPREKISEVKIIKQFDLFSDSDDLEKEQQNNIKNEIDENKIQNAVVNIKKKYGKNAILIGMNLLEGATARDKNTQIGGHHE